MEVASRLSTHAPWRRVGRAVDQLVEITAPATSPSVPQLCDALPEDDSAEPAEPRGLVDLIAALHVVASGEADTITLCGFSTGEELLRVGRELAVEGIAMEPLIRHGGGGIDIRVRRNV